MVCIEYRDATLASVASQRLLQNNLVTYVALCNASA